MYIPAHFREDDIAILHDTMRHNSFATLVTAPDGVPFATHLPVMLQAEPKPFGTLRGHVARANPQWQHFAEDREVLMVFSGPHGYISPTWYDTHPSVPTWNYAVVHAYGIPRLLPDAQLQSLLVEMTEVYEAGRSTPWKPEFSPDYWTAMLRAIVGFELTITRLEGKRKLSQNRSEDDRSQVMEALQHSALPEDAALAEIMRQERERSSTKKF